MAWVVPRDVFYFVNDALLGPALRHVNTFFGRGGLQA
jgi:hypothetical protein